MILMMLNFSVTLYMIGVIWMVQLVHYPLMASVGPDVFVRYQARHVRMMTFVVGPAMLVEVITMVLILASSVGIQFWLSVVGFALIGVIWLSTAFLQVPCHAKLEKGFDPETHRFLVQSNWIRTIAWTLRGSLMNWMIFST